MDMRTHLWMLEMFTLVRKKSEELKTNNAEEMSHLGKELWRSLRRDRHRRVYNALMDIE